MGVGAGCMLLSLFVLCASGFVWADRVQSCMNPLCPSCVGCALIEAIAVRAPNCYLFELSLVLVSQPCASVTPRMSTPVLHSARSVVDSIIPLTGEGQAATYQARLQ